ncbi:RecF/RecN/SMC protein [Anaeromyces robustus]|uniref:Structural maintenance of chromosomes protein n=2 Tax=Neocallimastigaceae TaxID=29007 RepID=A0A1Y1VTY6_9FUNG|nr:RecF/RecN/SMC protein [Anaeromyces robustus]|eukprot:ORX64475.1 RecF/RecN/SMC protein [Anaeromyces robustus]
MYIKQITIQGFKSYRDQTVISNFSPGHNVIVGRNGSGKSNFFAAIRFVLSDEYTNLQKEERQALIHGGTGPATISAYVEIVFDNSDNRFPTGNEEVVIRRTIGLKKDEYSLDKKAATKSDVMNLLESAGFSKSNPYYIVPQGKIISLTKAKDSARLQLLKEVAGTRIYEQRRNESNKIMEETELKKKKIEELLEYIEERLKELEEEKEELRQFQDADKEKRCIEYALTQQELEYINKILNEIEDDRQNKVQKINEFQEVISSKEQDIKEKRALISELKQKLEILKIEKQQFDEERNERIKAKTNLKYIIRNTHENRINNKQLLDQLRNDLNNINFEIQKKETELSQIIPLFQEELKKESLLRQDLSTIEIQQKSLYSKQSRSYQFRTKKERDQFLKNEIKSISNTINIHTKQSEDLKNDITTSENKKISLENEINEIRAKTENQKETLSMFEIKLQDVNRQREKLIEERKQLWRKETKSTALVENYREEINVNKNNLYSILDRNQSNGIQNIQNIVEKHNIDGVYGPLYSLFKIIHDRYNVPVEVVAGNSLFHIVVDNDDTATRILEYMTDKNSGRVTFMPLNRLHPKPVKYPQDNSLYQTMLSVLEYDPMFEKAFQQVFGKAIICPNIEIASQFARTDNINAVTLDGDRADRKGTLTGGFIDNRKSKLEAILNISKYKDLLDTESSNNKKLKAEIERLNQEITKTQNVLTNIDLEKHYSLDNNRTLTFDLENKSRENVLINETIAQKQKSLQEINLSIMKMNAQIQLLNNELKTDMISELSNEEQILLERITNEIDQKKAELLEVSTERAKNESRKNILENDLNSNLILRREQINSKIESLTLQVEENKYNNYSNDLTKVSSDLKQLEQKISEYERNIDNITKKIMKENNGLESIQSELETVQNKQNKYQSKSEKYLAKRSRYIQQREESMFKIRELGVLPDEAFEKYQNVDRSILEKKFKDAKDILKKYSHINKKAFEQYDNFTKQRNVLNYRKDELDKSAQSIANLINVLDQRKDEAIERTFKQVSKYFSEVFEKLVPAGRGQLIMLKRANNEINESQENDKDSYIDQYFGVAIKVSFNSKTDEGLLIEQLSGGQKSLVALALIFSIQQCDPAPFYLFDEIDANLDAAHRKAVAAMIHELSKDGQFTTTTFRPELIENANQFYGVTFVNKVSSITNISKENALSFVESETKPQ